MRKLAILLCTSMVLVQLFNPPSVRAALMEFDALYVFGDSLSDTGNVLNVTGGMAPPPTRYFQGRFSNGPAWVEYLADELSLNLSFSTSGVDVDPAINSVSYAFGGAGTGMSNITPGGFEVPGILGQLGAPGVPGSYIDALGGQPINPQALNVVFGGANDYLFGLTADPNMVVGNLTMAIESLYGLGARNFLVPNLPNLGQIPLASIIDPPEGANLGALTSAHNNMLALALLELSMLTDINLISVDFASLFEELLSDPGAFGFTSGLVLGPASGCLLAPPEVPPETACSPIGFESTDIFWDELHPTSMAHALLAQAAVDALSVPAPSVLWLFTIGLALLSVRRLKRFKGGLINVPH